MHHGDTESTEGQFTANLLHFGRLLRSMGLPVSTGQVMEVARGLSLIDITNRADFYITTRGLLVTDPDDFERFDQAFDLFWTGVQKWLLTLGQTRHLRRPADQEGLPSSEEPVLAPGKDEPNRPDGDPEREAEPQADTHVNALYSAVERLRYKNFATFSDEEKEIARRAMEALVWRFNTRLTRRLRRANKRAHRLDLRRSIRANVARGGEIIELSWRRRKHKPRPLVVICDISGSMDQYSRLFLHFIHSLSQGTQKTEAFVFGTRLTWLTPALRYSNVDTAVDRMAHLVRDWSGGTRIGESLKTFNYQWSRRVLGRGAIVLVISDGWERGDMALLRREVERLSQSAYRLIWLNPLAGTPGYEPRVQGIQTVLPFCDDFLPLHNLHSLEQLVARLGSAIR